MPGSTYSSNLKIELMNTGENSGTWGDVTNTNLGTALEQAIIGYGNPDYTSDANLTITITNSNASQAARCLVLNVTSVFGALTATRELIVPTSQKQYIVQNNTTGGQSITVKTSAGTGITVPNGRKAHLYVNGTDVVQMFDFVDINGGAIDGTPIGASSASTGAFTTLGATGNVTLGDADTDTITQAASYVTGTQLKSAKTATNTLSLAAYDVDGTAYTNLITLTAGNTPTLALTSTGVGTINNMSIGATTASTGAFTTLSASGAVTLSGGTENGVAYLNGSKVLTTGSALSFDGTNFVLNNGYIRANNTIGYHTNLTATGLTNFATSMDFNSVASHIFSINSSEIFRTTSTSLYTASGINVGIGTSSPASFFSDADNLVVGTTSGNNGLSLLTSSTGTATLAFGYTTGTSAGNGSNRAKLWYDGTSDTLRMSNGGTLMNSAQFVLDSSGNLGIGTTSPAQKLDVYLGTTGTVGQYLRNTTVNLLSKIDGTSSAQFGTETSHPLVFITSNTERMRLDSSGNLGIGTTSPSFRLHAVSSAAVVSRIGSSGGSGAFINFIDSGASPSVAPSVGAIGNSLVFMGDGSSSERARIDSSGNLLVGTTGLGTIGSSSGSTITASGAIYSASTGESIFSRRSTNGDLLLFRRDTTGVGAIAVTTTGVTLTGTNGITFTASQTASADANTLDDYEEGTFTPTLEYSGTNTPTYIVQTGRYTKIGRIVQIQILLVWNENGSTGNLLFTNLPFTSVNSTGRAAVTFLSFGLLVVTSSITGYVVSNATSILPVINDNAGTQVSATNTDGDQDVYMTVTYEAA